MSTNETDSLTKPCVNFFGVFSKSFNSLIEQALSSTETDGFNASEIRDCGNHLFKVNDEILIREIDPETINWTGRELYGRLVDIATFGIHLNRIALLYDLRTLVLKTNLSENGTETIAQFPIYVLRDIRNGQLPCLSTKSA